MKKLFIFLLTITAFFVSLSVSVSASENIYTKQTGIYTTDLDYRNSLIDWNGFNIEFNIYLDKRGGASPTNPRVYAMGDDNTILYDLTTFDYDEITEMFKLRTTSVQNNYIKAILFDRTTEVANRRLIIDWANNQTGFILFEIRLQFKSLLNINFSSVYTDDIITLQDADVMEFNKIITFFREGIPLTGISLDTENTQVNGSRQRALYNFKNTITNIDEIYLSYTISKEITETPKNGSIVLREIGLFATNQIILPNLDVDTDFTNLFPITTCDILNLPCHTKNVFTEISSTLYNSMGAEGIATSLMTIVNLLLTFVLMFDDTATQNLIFLLQGLIPIALIMAIVKKVT